MCIVSWYQEIDFLISRNAISWYQEMYFLISRNRILDIKKCWIKSKTAPPRSSSPLIVIRDSFSHQTWTRYLIYNIHHLSCMWPLHFGWLLVCFPSADPEGGTGVRTPPPSDLSEMGSCVEAWWEEEEVQRLFLPYYYHFFSGSLRSPILYNHITCKHTCKINVQYWTVILSLYMYFPNPNYEKNTTFMKVFFLELHDFTPFQPKYIRGKTPSPLPDKSTISKLLLLLLLSLFRNLAHCYIKLDMRQ